MYWRMGRVSAVLQVFVGTVTTLLGVAAISYLFLFYVGLTEEVSIDVVSYWHHPALLSSQPLLNNTLLLLIFCISHSVMARQWLKDLFSSLFKMSPSTYRQFYFAMSSLSLFVVYYGWTPQPSPVWDIQFPPIRYAVYGVGILAFLLHFVAFYSLLTLDFFGIEEPLLQLTGSRKKERRLKVDGLYGYVRHPMYTGLITFFCCHPTMSAGRLLMTVALAVYMMVAVPYFEEPDLIKLFGKQYESYMRTTPMFFPISTFLPRGNNNKID